MHSNTEDYIQETTNKKLKTYKPASTLATPAKAVETTGTIQAKATPPEPTPVDPIPDTFMVHYWRMAKTHDMDALLEACKEGGFIEKHRTMLSDPECSMLERTEIQLAGSVLDDTLEELLVVNGKCWNTFIELVVCQTTTDLDSLPNLPNLRFHTKYLHHFLKWVAEQVAENEAKAEPVIVATVTEKKEPNPVVEAKPEPVIVPVVAVPTLEDADCLSLDPDQTVIPWTAEQGKAWFAEQVAKKAAEAQTIEQKKSKPKQPAKPFHLCNVA